jgi:predicted signal transduction protein with EAL and GGDEF domain
VRLSESNKSKAVALLILAALVFAGSHPGISHFLQRLNHVLYDTILPLQSSSFSDDIVIVAIDDNSLQELGRWPWSRSIHAELINQLTRLKARAIGLDIIFSENQTNTSQADQRLAKALQDNQRTVLAVAPARQHGSELITELLPIPLLASSAAGMGHVDVELDVDGLCRSTFLHGGLTNATWPSFALALLEISGNKTIDIPFDNLVDQPSSTGWMRKHRILIPFTRADQPKQYSYSDVVSGRIPETSIRDKFILVGATASGLGDAISTPGAFSHERMPGIVLNAQILNGLLQDTVIHDISGFQHALISAFLIAIFVVGVFLTPERYSLITALSGVLITLLTSIVLLTQGQYWFAPIASAIAIILAWPLWTLWKINRSEMLRRRLQQQLDYQSRHHMATHLPNIKVLEEKLQQVSQQSPSTLTGLMVIHINWPGSASVVMDRPISDPVLQSISSRLSSVCSDQSFIAHLSGDDFAIVSTGYSDTHEIHQAAENLLNKLQEPLNFKHEKLLLAPQIGLSIWPSDTRDTSTLLRNAYTAMFKSRIDETEHLCVYSTNIGNELQARSQLEQALISALERDEFEMYYQPQVDAVTEKIVGVEALLRWNNPILGWVSPDNFIPVTEHIGLINRIGEWIIETTCFQLHIWKQTIDMPLRLAINVSPLQFMAPGLGERLRTIIEKYDIDPAKVELEITETSLMHDMNNALTAMHQIKQYGMELAIDDFGTGFSSLSNLRHFPLDRLKLDRSFTMEIGVNPDTTEITLTILAMAKNLGLGIIAEGVETPEQAEFLRHHGCDEFQGFLYGKPVTAEEVTNMLLAQ